ncbi:MAG: efflux RND transporter periplasmic adaptor subunit [Aestuariibacter sp.]
MTMFKYGIKYLLVVAIFLPQMVSAETSNVHLRGVVVPERQINMALNQTGVIDFIAPSGSVVEKGGIIAQIRTEELEAQYQQAKAVFTSAKADLAAANHSLQKTKRLVDEDILSDIAYTEAQFSVQTARAAVEVNRSKYHLAKLALSQAKLLAPFDGVVAETTVQEGEWAQKADPVISFASLEALMMSTDIPPELTDTLVKGTATDIIFQGQKIGRATVRRLYPMLQPASGLRRVVWSVDTEQSLLVSGRYVELAPWF